MSEAVPVRAPDGSVGTIDASEIDAATANGFVPLTAQDVRTERQREYLEREMGGVVGQLASGAIGFGRSATFGLSDRALIEGTRLIGGDDEAETMRDALRLSGETNPGATLAGEVGGFLAPTGFVGAVGKGARAAGRAAAHVLPEAATLLGRAGRAAVEAGVVGALEGAAVTAGSQVSEDALGDHETTGEKLFAAAGKGALFGAALGGILGAGGKIASEGAEALGGLVRQGLVRSSEEVGLPTLIRQEAEEQAYRATGAKTAANERLGATAVEQAARRKEVGRALLDEGIVTPTASKIDMATKVDEKLATLGSDLSKMRSRLNASTVRPDMLAIVQRARAEVLEPLATMPGYRAEARAVADYLDDLAKLGPRPDFEKAFDVRIAFDKKLKFDKLAAPGAVEELRKVRGILEEELTTAGERAAQELGETFANKYQTTKELYSKLADARAVLKKEVARDTANRAVSLTDTGAAMGGLLFGGAPGAIALGIGNKLLRTYGNQVAATLLNKASTIESIQRLATSVDQKIAAGVRGFFERGATPSTRATMPRAEVQQRAIAITTLAANDDALVERVRSTFGGVSEHAPKAATSVAATATLATKFLASRAPKSRTPLTSLTPHLEAPRYSEADITRFTRYLEAVEDPASVLEDMARGTLTREGVEALQAVYPKLYKQIQREAMEHLATSTAPLPYAERLQLGMLLGVPADPTLEPSFVGAMQAAKATDAQMQPKPSPQGGSRRPVKIDTNAFKTESERMAE